MTSTSEESPSTPTGVDGEERIIEIDGDKGAPLRHSNTRYTQGRLFATVMVLLGLAFIMVGYFSFPTELPKWKAPKFVIHKDATLRKIEELGRESTATLDAALEDAKAASAPRTFFPAESASVPKVIYRKAEGR